MKKYLLLLLLPCLIMCEKDKDKKDLFIRGRLFLLDTLTTNSNHIPMANKKVTLSYQSSDSLNYLYATTTNADGYFLFDLVAEGSHNDFMIRYEDSIGKWVYSASSPAKKGDNQKVLIAQLNENKTNGIIIRLVNIEKEYIPNVTIRLYNNKSLAAQNEEAGAIETITSNAFGKAYKLNLPAGKYYLNASKSIDTITYWRMAKTVTIKKTGINSEDTMLLIKKVPDIKNGFEIRITDSLGGSIPLADANVYLSKVVAETNNTAAALYSLKSNEAGIVSKTNIPAGKYFLNTSILLDTVKLIRIAKELEVSATGMLADTVVLRLQKKIDE